MMGSQTSTPLRWAVIIALSCATAGMVGVSMRANYLFGYGFGQTAEKAQVFAWANVAADLWKVSGLILIGSLWRAQHKRLALLLFPIWLLCLVWGMLGAIGVYAQDRAALIGSRENATTAYADAERELADVRARLGPLTSRSVEQVDAAIAAVLARPVRVGERIRGTVGKLSNNCAREERATADACLEVARLREERAAAMEAARLRQRADELAGRIASLRQHGAGLSPDAAAELVAWLSAGQLRVRDISFGFPLAFALLIELISAFGPAGIVAFAEATGATGKGSDSQPERATASRGELRPDMARLGAPQLVVRWMAERTEPTSANAAISIETLHADYGVWCNSLGAAAAGCEVFQRDFDAVRDAPELRGSIRKFGDRYYGIRLVAPRALLSDKRRAR